MKVNYEPLWKTVLFPKWNHMGSELTTGLFDFSDCNVAIETFSFPLCLSLHCCNKLDIISASTLKWSLRGLECVDQLLKVGFKSKASVIAKSWNSHTALICLQSLQVIRSSEKKYTCVFKPALWQMLNWKKRSSGLLDSKCMWCQNDNCSPRLQTMVFNYSSIIPKDHI